MRTDPRCSTALLVTTAMYPSYWSNCKQATRANSQPLRSHTVSLSFTHAIYTVNTYVNIIQCETVGVILDDTYLTKRGGREAMCARCGSRVMLMTWLVVHSLHVSMCTPAREVWLTVLLPASLSSVGHSLLPASLSSVGHSLLSHTLFTACLSPPHHHITRQRGPFNQGPAHVRRVVAGGGDVCVCTPCQLGP